MPFADRHGGVVVTGYPADLPGYTAALPRLVRRQIREALLPEYEGALRLFDPRFDLNW
ncbi:MAG TPA: hypothetical protein VNG13_14975 [Mycobacteriales bacterium]|nr:hypothetical protein [Mycobacteriales bacterium]